MSEGLRRAKLVGPPEWKKNAVGVAAIATGLVSLVGIMRVGAPVILASAVMLGCMGYGIARLFWTPASLLLLECPYCMGSTKPGATVCPHCGREFVPPE